jgi:hypothetical protein
MGAQSVAGAPARAQVMARRLAAVAMILGSVAVVLGSLMPWAKVTLPLLGTRSTTGLDSGGDAVFCIAVGVAACLVGLRTLISGGPSSTAATERAVVALVGVLGVVCVVFALLAARNVDSRLNSLFGSLPGFARSFVSGEIGAGIWVVAVGAAVVAVASLVQVLASAPSRG